MVGVEGIDGANKYNLDWQTARRTDSTKSPVWFDSRNTLNRMDRVEFAISMCWNVFCSEVRSTAGSGCGKIVSLAMNTEKLVLGSTGISDLKSVYC